MGGPHLSAKDIVNGTLSDGRIELTLDADRMKTDRTFFATVNQRIPIVLRAPFSGSGIVGFLIRVGHKEDSPSSSDVDLTDALSPPTNNGEVVKAKVEETYCREENAGAITHKDREPKYIVKGELFLEEAVSDLILDVTVVMENSAEKSEFYYSQYQLQAVDTKVESTNSPGESSNMVYFGDSPSSSSFVQPSLTGLLIMMGGFWI